MEITLKGKNIGSKKVDFNEGYITSLQSNVSKELIDIILDNYDGIYICNSNLYFLSDTVRNEIELCCEYLDYELLESILNALDIEYDFLDKRIKELSYTEKVYLNIIRNIVKNNKIIIFDDIFKCLDYASQKRIKGLLNYLKDNMYIVLITSEDVNVLYKLADYSIVWYKKFFVYGRSDDVYTDVAKLVKNKIEVPILPLITYKAKTEKNVKLFYSKDVRDIIKDIYKHV